MSLADFFGGAEAPEPIDPTQLARQTIGVQDAFLPELQRLRGQHNPGLIQQSLWQAGRAQEGLAGVASNIAGDIGKQRQQLTGGDMNQLRQQSSGFAGAERLQQLMQKQAEDELRLNGQLSPEMQRNIDQMTQARTQAQGRGAGAFNVGQLALGRQGAVQQRQDRARQFAGGTAQLGLQTSNPLQRIMSQNAQTSGNVLDRLRNIQGFGQQNTVNFDPINANVANIAQNQFNAQQQEYLQDKSFLPDIIGGGMSMAGSIFGGPSGGAIASKIGGLFG